MLANAQPKPVPRVVEKAVKAKQVEAHRIAVKSAVWARDKGQCRVCGGHATEMHELQFRSLGGVRSTQNSIAVCAYAGRNCHRLLQTHAIHVEGDNADKRLVFTWNRERVPVGSEPFRILSKRRSQNR
jgi:hypothetical protein